MKKKNILMMIVKISEDKVAHYASQKKEILKTIILRNNINTTCLEFTVEISMKRNENILLFITIRHSKDQGYLTGQSASI